MRRLLFHRKSRFVGSLMPYWIIFKISKKELLAMVRALEDSSHKKEGEGMWHMDFAALGTEILNGQTLELTIPKEVPSFFVVSRSGISEEIVLEPDTEQFCREPQRNIGGNRAGARYRTILF